MRCRADRAVGSYGVGLVEHLHQSRGPGGRVRAADVAHAAGVSISTVSLVVNDKWRGRVADPTAQRVLELVDQMGYVVHESARRLATGASAAIAIIAPVFTNPFYAKVSLGAAGALGGRYQLVFPVPEDHGDTRSMLLRVLDMGLDGALLASPTADVVEVLPDDFPVVVLDAPDPVPGRSRVNLDVQGGAAAVARFLMSAGHRCVAYMDGRPDTSTLAVRRTTLQRAISGLIVSSRLASVVDSSAAWRCAVAELPALLDQGVTAVVCCTDLHAYGVMRALAELGVRVPDDVSVVGFDDQPHSAFMVPSLTTVSFPADELGSTAAKLLVELIEAGPRARPPTVVELVLPSSLVVRGSTAVAASRP
jgi:LacI family transcriptional regulator